MRRKPSAAHGSDSSSSTEPSTSTTSSSYELSRSTREAHPRQPSIPEPVTPTPHVEFRAVSDVQVEEPADLSQGYPDSRPPSEESSIPVAPPHCAVCLRNRREARRIKRTLFEMWFVCLMTLAALVIPLGLILAPYLGYYIPAFDAGASTAITTPNPWTNVDESCLAQVKLSDNVHNLRADNASPATAPGGKATTAVFCLYNNSRFRKRLRWDYLPKHIPFQLCPNVIYWSMGIQGAKVISRVPEFEVRYGMWTLRATQQRYAPSAPVNIHMAVGGYLEDSAHFSRLGRDSVLMTKLAVDILKKLVRHRLNGITIHWRDMQGTCGGPRDFETLRELAESIRRLYEMNGLPYFVTIIIDTKAGVEKERELVNSLDLIFYETHHLNDSDAIGWCRENEPAVQDFLSEVSLNTHAGHIGKVCTVLSMGISTSDYTVDQSGKLDVLTSRPVSNISNVPGMAALFEMCPSGTVAMPAGPNTCEIRYHDVVPPIVPAQPATAVRRVYAVKALVSLIERFSFPHPCVLVVDIDFDLYRGTCAIQNIPHHHRLYQVWSALP
ncbi:hypothetical protein IscW_ISCW020281 [Ixodes scapularis]|uniref:Chitinase n=1 Tax=Ixodes scapularis TaxID=6945 RepID=B7Q2U4_IXOSC|nr:hypothetical protein IscW_ISCW020281 [Ixodes scapularis]|eukprot:XP_002411034.1 hypothetical protein IscW_ISCW020281 [Ixodes scapularis]